mmetsp:Transcript_93607/g.195153  ORF Transcript_93607/g.195153 Transcript_93607/m.195153 type:complete len:116 (-) Transcript_93607:817-1164(-)
MPPPKYFDDVTPVASPEISQFGCTGPNNCYSTQFRWEVVVIYLCYILLNHAFVKLVLQGPVASYLRRRQKHRDQSVFGTIAADTSTDDGSSTDEGSSGIESSSSSSSSSTSNHID